MAFVGFAIHFYLKSERLTRAHQTNQVLKTVTTQAVEYAEALDQQNRELRQFKNNIKTFTTKTSPDKIKAFAKKRK